MTEPTRGPWIAGRTLVGGDPDRNRREIYGLPEGAHQRYQTRSVCVLNPYFHEWTETDEANLRLILAAHDLRSGCSALLGLIDLILNRDDLTPELRAVLQPDNHRIAEAEAALRKAVEKNVEGDWYQSDGR